MGKLQDIIAGGAPSIGMFQMSRSVVAAEAMGALGLDWIIADIQHGEITWDDVLAVIHGIEAGGALPFVRVGWNDPVQIMRALDFGAMGVVVPMVSTAQDALIAANAMRYPPRGIRSLGPTRRLYGRGGFAVAESNDQVFCLPMIETAEGLSNVEAIAATPGVDGLLLGPGDLSLSMGWPLAADPSAEMLDAVDRIVAACDKNGIVAAAVALSAAGAEILMRRGMRFISVGSDMGCMVESGRSHAAQAATWRRQFMRGA